MNLFNIKETVVYGVENKRQAKLLNIVLTMHNKYRMTIGLCYKVDARTLIR